MSIVRWSPFFFEPFETMDKLVDDMQQSLAQRGSNSIIPPIDMYETDKDVVVEVPMPGVDSKHLELSIENSLLTIKGSMERKTEVDDKNYYRKEVRSGTVFRQVALPARVADKEAQANFENGVLTITLPKLAGSSSVKIAVKKTI